jgi:hypothetical protein
MLQTPATLSLSHGYCSSECLSGPDIRAVCGKLLIRIEPFFENVGQIVASRLPRLHHGEANRPVVLVTYSTSVLALLGSAAPYTGLLSTSTLEQIAGAVQDLLTSPRSS